MLLLIIYCWLLTTISFCNASSYGNEAETIKEYHLCKKLANNGVCDPGCLGFDSFETQDCSNVEFDTQNYKIVVNAYPFMHSVESWKIVRELTEKRYYRVHLTIDVSEDDYANITNHCTKLMKEWKPVIFENKTIHDSISSFKREPSIFEYCPVEVNATFYIPHIDSPEVIALRKECKEKDNNGKCDMMCRGFDEFEEKECQNLSLEEGTAALTVDVSKREMLRPCEFFLRHIEARYRREFNMQFTIKAETCHTAFFIRFHSFNIPPVLKSSDEFARFSFDFDSYCFYGENEKFLEYSTSVPKIRHFYNKVFGFDSINQELTHLQHFYTYAHTIDYYYNDYPVHKDHYIYTDY